MGHVDNYYLNQIIGALPGDNATLNNLGVGADSGLKCLEAFGSMPIHGNSNMGSECQP